jgi:carbonic anhydrase/acetyltransferase-like protein (isoleucine patch superfamily)
MPVERSGVAPTVSADAWVASSAVVAGNVTIGAGCVIDHGALQVSSGPQIRIAAGVAVMPGAVIRSTGGADRLAFPGGDRYGLPDQSASVPGRLSAR